MHPAVASLLARLGSGDPAPVTGLPGAAGAWLLARLAARHPAPTLVVTPSPESARRLHADLRLLVGLDGTRGTDGADDPNPPLAFPAWDNLPHEFASPLPEVSGARMAALLACREAQAPVLVAPVAAVLHRVPPPEALAAYALVLAPGDTHDPAGIDQRLAAMGYRAAPQVEQPGQFTLKGDILDVFPPAQDDPLRIEWFGDEVERIRAFDPVTQRSTEPVARAVVPPATELPDDEALVARAQERVRELAARRGLDPAAVTLETGRLARTPRTEGIETWAPFFFEQPMPAVTAYLGAKPRVVLVGAEAVRATARGLMRKAAQAMADEAARGTLLPEVGDLFVDLEGVTGGGPVLALEPEGEGPGAIEGGPWRTPEALGFGPLEAGEGPRDAFAARFAALAGLAAGGGATVVCPDAARANAFRGILAEHGVAAAPEGGGPGVRLATGQLSEGFGVAHDGGPEAFLTEAEVFGRQPAPPPLPRSRMARFLSGFGDLKAGDAVVHRQHGIGIYRGLKRLTVGGSEGDFLEVEYLGGDRVYVPMDRLDLVQKHAGGDGGTPRLDRMGGKTWERTRSKVRRALAELAQDLVDLAAAREVARGHAFAPEGAAGLEFAASFDHTETPDQLRAIADTLDDMQRPRPMDRLVCGDVGYGKTEVALRAAFKAMLDGRQVVFLVPTTLLARQHFGTCRRRFAGYPFRVAQLSRFQPAAAQKAVLEELEQGRVDLVVATHRLLTRQVKIPHLGLLIVDEEQRFGVAHKERIKQWKTSVDVLTLTATPIPRTLQLSLIGVRDLSIIDTPPPDRRAIQTRVARFDPTLIGEAVERELARGGQVFFIHNRVKDIGAMAAFLSRLVPKARIGTAHGQMPERRLEEVMAAFVDGETDVLLSTSIVEAGLDIPRANTIIIDRADRFGLSELYQLRGRVGRSGVQAYAYLLGPEEGWHGDARDRLMAIQAFSELGAGFRIAARDLEIRGAGSLLGHRQSGQIAAVGIDTYMELIKEAMAEVRGETLEPEFQSEVRLGAPAAIPDDYVADGGARLSVYKRVAGLAAPAEVDALAEELADRFGPVPAVVADLLEQARIRILARRLRLKSLRHAGAGRYALVFDTDHALSEVGLRLLLDTFGPRIRFRSEHAFEIDLKAAPDAGGLAALTELLAGL